MLHFSFCRTAVCLYVCSYRFSFDVDLRREERNRGLDRTACMRVIRFDPNA
jgi:hypothetical protein